MGSHGLRQTVCFVCAGFFLACAAHAQRHDSNTVIVTYRDRPTSAALHERVRSRSLEVVERFSAVEQRLGRAVVVLSVRGRRVEDVAAEMKGDPSVQSVDLNYYAEPATSIPDDPGFREQWALVNTGQTINGMTGTSGVDIRWLDAMRLAPPTGEVVVAVVDTGVDYTHPDLAPSMWVNPAEIPGNGIDDDTNGVIDDVYGFDRTGQTTSYIADGDPMDGGSHGTQVAGAIAARANNTYGSAGANPRVRIMALKHALRSGSLFSHTISCYDYVIQMKGRGVNVVAINASFGGSVLVAAFQDVVVAAGAAGIVTCAAAGNLGVDLDLGVTPSYPASLTDNCVVAVAATGASDELMSYSNYGTNLVDLAAPGNFILTTYPLLLSTTSSLSLAYTNYLTVPMEYCGLTTGITASVLDCNIGTPTSFPPAVAGKIALSGDTTNLSTFAQATNAMAAGAAAALVFGSTPGAAFSTLGSPTNWIPVVTMDRADGLNLRAHLPAVATLAVLSSPTNHFRFQGGTSLAAPFVTAALALMAVAHPSDSVTQRIARVLSQVHPVASLNGKVRTGGRLDLAAPLDTDSDALGDWWELQYTNSLAHLTGGADSDGDGVKNADEFVAGTHPLFATSHLHFVAEQKVTTNGIALQWSSSPGKRYRLQRGGLGGAWTNTTPFLPATPVLNVYTTIAGGAFEAWRLDVE